MLLQVSVKNMCVQEGCFDSQKQVSVADVNDVLAQMLEGHISAQAYMPLCNSNA